MGAKLLETVELPIRQIGTSDRLRPISETAVLSLELHGRLGLDGRD